MMEISNGRQSLCSRAWAPDLCVAVSWWLHLEAGPVLLFFHLFYSLSPKQKVSRSETVHGGKKRLHRTVDYSHDVSSTCKSEIGPNSHA